MSANHDPFALIDFQPAAIGSDVARGPMTRTNLAVNVCMFITLCAVLAGVNATPCGWPAASVDTGCGRHRSAPVGRGQEGTSTDQDPHNKSLYGIRGLTGMNHAST